MLHNAWRIITDCSPPDDPNPDGIDVWDSRYSCGCNLNLAAAVYAGVNLDVSSEVSLPADIEFSTDGLTLYVFGQTTDDIFQYTLTTAWDVSTATYASKSFTGLTSENSSPRAIAFSYDGTKLYALGGTSPDSVFQYTLSTAWDISTAVYASKSLDVSSESTSTTDIDISIDGTKLYYQDSNSAIFQYTLATPWDISTATYDSITISVYSSIPATSVKGIALSRDGLKLYLVNYGGGEGDSYIYQLTLSTAWDLSTAVYDSTADLLLNIASSTPNGIAVAKDTNCTKIYVVDSADDEVHQYS